jgi:hypothetical protein
MSERNTPDDLAASNIGTTNGRRPSRNTSSATRATRPLAEGSTSDRNTSS